MEVEVRRLTSWADALDYARETVGKKPLHKEPSSEWKTRILVAGHSPARTVMFAIRFTGIKSWVSVHLVRHSKFAEHFVSTQRPDRTGADVDRDELPQGAKVNHTIVTNAMEIIAISKKRLCRLAAPETREAWEAVVRVLGRIGEKELAAECVPECESRGYVCPEMHGCGKCPPRGVSSAGRLLPTE